LNNLLVLIPLLAILGGVGLTFDSAFASDGVLHLDFNLDKEFCKKVMDGKWKKSVCAVDNYYALPEGYTL